jgi:hypothetical protein
MPQYWLSVLTKGFRDALDFVKQDKQGLAFIALVFILTALWLYKKHGWKDAMTKWWRTIGEGAVIATVAWTIVFFAHLVWEPYHLQDDLANNRKELQKEYDARESSLRTCEGDLRIEQNKGAESQKQVTAQRSVMQGLINGQQGTVNNCVVALEKLAVGEPQKILTFVHQINQSNTPAALTQVVLLTTKRTHLQGTLQCDHDFKLIDWRFGAEMGITSIKSSSSSANTWNISVGLPEWEPNMPIMLFMASQSSVGMCSFVQ